MTKLRVKTPTQIPKEELLRARNSNYGILLKGVIALPHIFSPLLLMHPGIDLSRTLTGLHIACCSKDVVDNRTMLGRRKPWRQAICLVTRPGKKGEGSARDLLFFWVAWKYFPLKFNTYLYTI